MSIKPRLSSLRRLPRRDFIRRTSLVAFGLVAAAAGTPGNRAYGAARRTTRPDSCGEFCTVVSCSGCACGGNLFNCVGCGVNNYSCHIAPQDCTSFCLVPVC
jgi:hypothetical protein